MASSVVLAIDAHVNRCCPRALEVLDWSVHLGRGVASGRMHFRMRVLPPVIMSWTISLSLLMTPVGYRLPHRKAGPSYSKRRERVFIKLPTHRSLPARSKPCRSSLSSASHAASRSTLLGGVSARTSATACSATLPIFTKKDTCKNLRIYFNISNIFKD